IFRRLSVIYDKAVIRPLERRNDLFVVHQGITRESARRHEKLSRWATEDRVRLLLEAAGLLQSARQSACLSVPAHRRCTSCSRSDQSKRLVPWGWPASSCTCR